MAKKITFEEITLRLEISSRGGGIKIDLTRKGFKGHTMVACQNYLGGGMLGKVYADFSMTNFNKPYTKKQLEKLLKISEELKRYYFDLTNPDTEWEEQTYQQNQKMAVSSY